MTENRTDSALSKTLGCLCGHMRINTAARLADSLGMTVDDMYYATVGDLDSDQIRTLARALRVSSDKILGLIA